ncbi:MAG TPA: tRNA (adenosine(37)-N6)-dimethylallyltransferase MiaA [Fibrobacteria bacterium]|nr:tRNA (adenosine(37)-N6)-dimethylallyltransferase MiaA [Fibrobacteria bacterium]
MHLLVLCGPTATGKTALAADLAHRLGTELISADSRQVYRGLDLGTGKDLGEYRKHAPPVRYHLIDIVDPEAGYSLFQYQRDCYRVMDLRAGEGGPASRVMVLAGGTGMYIEAVLRRYRIANVPENPALRESLAGRSREELEAELKRKDAALAARSDLSSGKRIIRALEVWQAGQARAVEYSRPPERDFSFTVFGTRMDRAALRARIDARLEARLEAGMVEEVAGLLARGVSRERMQVLGMEYREITRYLTGECTREEMAATLRHEIHMLAKRQETYFRGMERRGVPITWLDPEQGADALLRSWDERKASHG